MKLSSASGNRKEQHGRKSDENAPRLRHRWPRSVSTGRAPRGRRTCDSVTWSISASTSAASFSREVFIALKSPSEYLPKGKSKHRFGKLFKLVLLCCFIRRC